MSFSEYLEPLVGAPNKLTAAYWNQMLRYSTYAELIRAGQSLVLTP